MKKIDFFVLLPLISIIFMVPIIKPPAYKSTELEKITDGDTVEYRLNGQLTYASGLHYAKLVKTKSGMVIYTVGGNSGTAWV